MSLPCAQSYLAGVQEGGQAPNLVQVYSVEGAVTVMCNKVSYLQGLYILHSLEGAAEECQGLVLCSLRGQEW